MKSWLYYIIDEQGKSYTIQNGVVKLVGTPTPLANTPDGWQDITIAWERNMQKVGLVRNFTLPLSFVRDAAKILRHIFFSESIDKKVYLLIQRLTLEIDNSNFSYKYNYFYKGEIDLTTTSVQDVKTVASIMEGGLSKLLKANESTTYELPVADDEEAILVRRNGLTLQQKINLLVNTGFTAADHVIGISLISKDGDAPGLAVLDVFLDNNGGGSIDFTTSTLYFLKSFQVITGVNISGTLSFTYGQLTGGTATVYLKTSHGRSISLATFSGSGNKIITINTNFDTEANENIFLYVDVPLANTVSYNESRLTIQYESRYKETYIKTYPANIAYKKIVEKITGNEAYAKSDVLLANKNFCITSGDAIRQINGAKIKTSFNDFFTSYNVRLNIGTGIENNQVLVEVKPHFLKTTNPIALGNVKDLKITYASDLAFSSIKIGYPEVNVEGVNGKYAFNNSHIYTTPNTKVSKQFDLVSKYKADPYEIEITALNLDGKTTTDDSNDNTVFFLDVDMDNPQTLAEDTDGYPAGTTFYNLFRETYDSTEGIYDNTTIFNVRLSPKRCLLAHGSWIRSAHYLFENQKLKFQTTEKNAGVKTIKGAEVIDEDADVLINNLNAPLFKPYYLEHENEVPVDLVDDMEGDPNQPFSVTWNDITYSGFNIKAALSANDLKTQVFKLLSSPDNDLTQFI